MTGKTWKSAEIMHKIETNQAWLEKAIVALYQRQTSYEQISEQTTDHNGVGFSASDASYLTYLAKYIESRQTFAKFGTILSGYHITKARLRMRKYSRQLTEIANS